MLRIYVCDDEPEIARGIARDCERFLFDFPQEYELAVFYSGRDLLARTREDRADILFLDIELGEGNGIAVAKAIRQLDKRVKIIFVTSHRNYKSAAFTVRAFGYVEKPATADAVQTQLREALQYIAAEGAKTSSIHLDTAEGFLHFDPADLLYFENESRKVKLVTLSHTHRIRGKISALEKKLGPLGFASPHVSFLVNLDYVSDLRNYTAFLVTGAEIPVSQRRFAEFRGAMDRHLSETIRLCGEGFHE